MKRSSGRVLLPPIDQETFIIVFLATLQEMNRSIIFTSDSRSHHLLMHVVEGIKNSWDGKFPQFFPSPPDGTIPELNKALVDAYNHGEAYKHIKGAYIIDFSEKRREYAFRKISPYNKELLDNMLVLTLTPPEHQT